MPTRPQAASCWGYHYAWFREIQAAAAEQFENVVKLQPNETLSASFAKALRKAIEPAPVATAAATPAAAPAEAQPAAVAAQAPNTPTPPPAGPAGNQAPPAEAPEQQPPPPPPARMAGTWKAQPSPDVSITLTLEPDGQFAWDVDTKGQKQSLTGNAGFKDNELAADFQP